MLLLTDHDFVVVVLSADAAVTVYKVSAAFSHYWILCICVRLVG